MELRETIFVTQVATEGTNFHEHHSLLPNVRK